MSMRRPRHNLGRADWIGAEALGVPGQRTFRILVSGGGTNAQLWLEKEQLQELVLAIGRMLADIDMERGQTIRASQEAKPNVKPADFPDTPEIELFVGQLVMRYDAERDIVAMEVFDRNSPEENTPELGCLVDREQIEKLQQNGTEVLAGGRPRCPLCGAPLSNAGMPHFCPPTNGHQKLTSEE